MLLWSLIPGNVSAHSNIRESVIVKSRQTILFNCSSASASNKYSWWKSLLTHYWWRSFVWKMWGLMHPSWDMCNDSPIKIMIKMPNDIIFFFSSGSMTLDPFLPLQICNTTAPCSASASLAKAKITSTIVMTSLGLGFSQSFSSRVRLHLPQNEQKMIWTPKVWMMFLGTQS